MISVPSLAEVIAEPAKADGLPGRVLLDLCAELVAVQHRLTLRMLAVGLEPLPPREQTDVLLTIDQAAARVGIAPATMQKWLRQPRYSPAAVVLSRNVVRVSAQRLEQAVRSGGLRARRKAVSA